MGKLRLIAAIMFVGACGSDHGTSIDAPRAIDAAPQPDSKVFMDAPPPMYDFSCMGNAAPADGSATANITLSGTVQEVDLNGVTPTIMPADGATLNACKSGAANCMGGNLYAGPVTSAGGGNFTLGPIATGTNPLAAYLTVAKTGDRATRIYPPQTLAADLDMIPGLIFTAGAFQGAVLFAQATQSAANGTIGVAATDCANTPIDGATITVKQNGTAVAGTTDFDAGALSPMAAGVHIIFNVPPGDTEVGATYNNMTLQAHVVGVAAQTNTFTTVRPGYF